MDHTMGGSELPSGDPCGIEGTNIIYDEDTLFMSQTFDAAYEAIMRSGPDTPLDLPEVSSMENVKSIRAKTKEILPKTCSLLATGPWRATRRWALPMSDRICVCRTGMMRTQPLIPPCPGSSLHISVGYTLIENLFNPYKGT
ncbi:hypothetical protein BDW71DRAFT_162492 [Aspergillus fruticulosus]